MITKTQMKLVIIAIALVYATTLLITDVFAQTPPPLESTTTPAPAPEVPEEETTATPKSLGKITIQISQTEQIVLDLPIKSDNKYQVVPIK